jgi:transcriptional regulator with XRE-family HTH domain
MKITLKIVVMPRKKNDPLGFGKRLVAIRRLRGMTQIELAKSAGTTQRAISYYENDVGHPPAAALVALARALRVTTDELLGLKPPRPDARAEDPEMRRLWKKFQLVSTLPDRDQRAVIRLINSLARDE